MKQQNDYLKELELNIKHQEIDTRKYNVLGYSPEEKVVVGGIFIQLKNLYLSEINKEKSGSSV